MGGKKERGYTMPAVVMVMSIIFITLLILLDAEYDLYAQFKVYDNNVDSVMDMPEQYKMAYAVKDEINSRLIKKGVSVNNTEELNEFLKADDFEMNYDVYTIEFIISDIEKLEVQKNGADMPYYFVPEYKNLDVYVYLEYK